MQAIGLQYNKGLQKKQLSGLYDFLRDIVIL